MYVQQDSTAYTPADHGVWQKLCQRRVPELRKTACRAFLAGMDVIGLSEDAIPNLDEVNARLSPVTGWQAAAVHGYLPAKEFFQALSVRKFPTTIGIRREDQMDYLPEPDIFHDVFGHVPMHADRAFGDFLHYYGQVAFATEDESKLTELARLFWFTVEFGLIREDGKVKLFGSGLMSSPGEGAHCLTDAVQKVDFDLDKVINQHFEIDHYQPLLFVADSYEQLKDALEEWKSRQGIGPKTMNKESGTKIGGAYQMEQQFRGYVSRIYDDSIVLRLWDDAGGGEMRREFDKELLSDLEIKELGQPVEVSIVSVDGKPKFQIKPLGAPGSISPLWQSDSQDMKDFNV